MRESAELGVTDIELGTGNWSPAPHVNLDRLLADEGARTELLDLVVRHGVTLTALNASGNILHPVTGVEHRRVLDDTIRLAGLLGVPTVVAMSGLPAAPGDRYPNWVTTAWPPENHEILAHQWDIAIPAWTEVAALAADSGVHTVALELHPHQLVYNPRSFRRLRDAVGERISINLDPSHLMWLGADPIAVIASLTDVPGAIGHVHAKDTQILRDAQINTTLETTPFEQVADRSWNYITLGSGHPEGARYWARFVAALHSAGYDGMLSIEHEDEARPRLDGVAESVRILSEAIEASDLIHEKESS
ncbi:sugar phosphate isomerase/epimerase family protein [Microbacterium oleivorans]|uniref:sugar phosphate isomerase/epimerase family protein n=1 Tax=Microbacterium oleivorans TaxID=273677 RepID=UPI001C4A077F|nr:sugar phosphate isomerase/epimerase [Microbacterium oleivorans]